MSKKLFIGRSFTAVALLFTMFCTLFISTGTVSAAGYQTSKSLGCSSRYSDWYPSGIDVEVVSYNVSCYWPFSKASIWAGTGGGGSFTINGDAWQSHGTVPGSARFGETGRTGWVTIPKDGYFHNLTLSNVTWGVSDPQWGCAWTQVYGGATYDYMCVYVPQ